MLLEAGLLTPGGSARTSQTSYSRHLPALDIRAVVCRRFRSGYSGGGRAGVSPASLTFQRTLATFPERKITVKPRLLRRQRGRISFNQPFRSRPFSPTADLIWNQNVRTTALLLVRALDIVPAVV
jgi:hypothetical protein